MGERLSAGTRKHIAKDLKPEARQANHLEEAWQSTEKILSFKIEGYPENLNAEDMRVVREFFRARWEYRRNPGNGSWQKVMEREFLPRFPDEVLDKNSQALALISQILSK